MIVEESVNFERGQDPKKAMKIGESSRYVTVHGDIWGQIDPFVDQNSVIDYIEESQNFERGINPKKAMKIGETHHWEDIIENTNWHTNPDIFSTENNKVEIVDLIKDYHNISPIIVIRGKSSEYYYVGISIVDRTYARETPEEALHDAKIDIENWEIRKARGEVE